MTLYVTRHGETEWNQRGIVCGESDIPLAEAGRHQAAEMAESLKGAGLVKIITSPMVRARQTAAAAEKATGLVATAEPRLTERRFGAFEGLPYDDAAFMATKGHPAKRPPGGGESIFDLVGRVYPFLKELCQTGEGPVLLVTHGTVCRIIDSFFTGPEHPVFAALRTGNCQVRQYTCTNG